MVGKRLLDALDLLIQRIPGYRTVYSTIKQLTNAFSPENTKSFKEVLLVEYPKEGSYALGGNKLITAFRVVVPSALSGIGAAYILGISRAIGETMIVAVAAGMQPKLTANPTEQAATMTAYIVQVSLGDVQHGTVSYQTIFAVGLTLFCMTLVFNILGQALRRRFHQAY